MDTIAFAARQITNILFLVRTAEIETRHVGAGIDSASPHFQPLMTAGNLLEHRTIRLQRIAVLVHVAHFHRWSDPQLAAIRLLGVGTSRDLTDAARFDAPDDGNPDDRTVLVVDLPGPVAPGDSVTLTWTAPGD